MKYFALLLFCAGASATATFYPVAIIKDTVQISNSRIVGGQEAKPHAFPYQVALSLQDSSGETFICGGSLISNRIVLTAAHCVDGIVSATVKLGAHRLDTPSPGEVQQVIAKNNFIIHEKWNSDLLRNDVALIKLNQPVVFNDNIKPINLPRTSDVQNTYAQQKVTASGWGAFTDKSPYGSLFLRYVDLTVIGQNECVRAYGSFIQSGNICTSGSGGKSTCIGDSGGPLVIQEADGSRTLIGITSFGSDIGCEIGEPVAFVRVTSFLSWISSNSGIKLRQ